VARYSRFLGGVTMSDDQTRLQLAQVDHRDHEALTAVAADGIVAGISRMPGFRSLGRPRWRLLWLTAGGGGESRACSCSRSQCGLAWHPVPPRSRRDQGAARRARPEHLARPARPHAAGSHDPDRRARLRARRPAHQRRPPRRRRSHPDPRKGKERAATLTSETVKVMRQWLTERRGEPAAPVFATPPGTAAQPLHDRRGGHKNTPPP